MNNRNQIKGLIFDLDGVLLSTDRFHYLAWKKLADRMSIRFTEKDNERLRGVSRMESLEIVLSLSEKPLALSEEEKLAIATEKNEQYREYLKTMTPADVSAEVRSTLATLRERGYLLAVGSSSKNTRFILSQTALTDAFDAIADGNDIKNSKPDPEVFVKAAEFLGLEPKECLVVEDAEAGIRAACSGKFESAGLGEAANCSTVTYALGSFGDLLRVV